MRISPLPQGFGVEVADFDLRGSRDVAQLAALRRAFLDHHLLVFRGDGALSPERQVEITGWFGPVIAESGVPWTVLDNADDAGRLELPFHSDITFLEHPLAGISLHPTRLPRAETSTTYVSNAVAWRALPPALQSGLEGRKARHSYASDGFIDIGRIAFEHWHPVRMLHPETGEPLLFVTEHHVDRIEGVDAARSAELLKRLFAILYAPERRYEHVWRPGDLVVWNNLAVQHARTRAADPADGARIMQRVQFGEVGFLAQLATLREQQAA